MINLEHAKRVLAHQEDIESSAKDQIILEIAERLIAIENRISRIELNHRTRVDDLFLRTTNMSVRLDHLTAKLTDASK